MIGSRFVGNKAGMSSIDKERVSRIISENTNANFESHEKKRLGRIEEQVKRNRQKLNALTDRQINQTREELDKIIEEMEKLRRLDKIKVHIDMDAFFAAVECRDNVQLRDVPMAVGSLSMLSTSNYVARQFGVRSAMPGFIAKKLCPHFLIVPCSSSKYKRESSVFRAIFQRFDPDVSMGSLDEAYLDLTRFVSQRSAPVTCRRVRFMGPCICRLPLVVDDSELRPEVEQMRTICAKCGKERIEVVDSVEFGQDVDSIVRQLRFEVEQATGLTCSAGIASNSMLAKICSDLNKPNGQFRLENSRDAIVSFMHSLPVRKVPGIGAVTESLLKGLDVVTCGDLLEKRAIIHLVLSKNCSSWLLRVALGISCREIEGDAEMEQDDTNDEDNQKSTSVERTFTPTNHLAELLPIVRFLCARLISSLSSSDIIGGRAATLKIKFANFDVVTRCKSVAFVIASVDQLLPIMETMLRKELRERRNMAVRLLGVRLSQLVATAANAGGESKSGVQLSLVGFMARRPSANKRPRDEPPELIELSSSDETDREDKEEDGTKMDGKKAWEAEWETSAGKTEGAGETVRHDGEDRGEPTAETSERSQQKCDHQSLGIKGGRIIAVEEDDDWDEGIMNIDEYFDFADDDEVMECTTKSQRETAKKESRRERGGKRKRRKRSESKSESGNREAIGLLKYFQPKR